MIVVLVFSGRYMQQ